MQPLSRDVRDEIDEYERAAASETTVCSRSGKYRNLAHCLEHTLCHPHRCLKSCVGTRTRLGYAAFDAQLRKRILSLHFTLYSRLCVRMHAYAGLRA